MRVKLRKRSKNPQILGIKSDLKIIKGFSFMFC